MIMGNNLTSVLPSMTLNTLYEKKPSSGSSSLEPAAPTPSPWWAVDLGKRRRTKPGAQGGAGQGGAGKGGAGKGEAGQVGAGQAQQFYYPVRKKPATAVTARWVEWMG
jgi:hypothetical protein